MFKVAAGSPARRVYHRTLPLRKTATLLRLHAFAVILQGDTSMKQVLKLLMKPISLKIKTLELTS